MSEWHDQFCQRLDLFTSGGISSCLSCGSVQPQPDPSSTNDENIHGDIYQTLQNDTDMRLLTLRPGGYEDPVRGNLHLTTTSGFLEYDAISYTWAGEDENMERSGHIILNSRGFAVTPNCEAALRRARSRSGPKTIWIDAICINQEDLRERGHQVRLMQQIYSRADSVLIYLGEPNREENELLAFISGQDESLSGDRLWRLRKALCQLLKRRYFSRVWVLQEVALARRAILICGEHSIPWSLMEIQRLNRRGLLECSKVAGFYSTLYGVDGLPPVILNFRAPAFRDPSELLQLLETTRRSRASDPRDKVFALLGLLTCPESDGLVADYTKSTAEIYKSIAIWIAQRFGLPELLSRTRVLRERQLIDNQGPQWVPDWAHDDFQLLKSGLINTTPSDFEQKPARTLISRLPVTVCEQDTTAIKFPAVLLGAATQVLHYRDESGGSMFDSVPRRGDHTINTEGEAYALIIAETGASLERLRRSRYLESLGCFIHLNYRVKRQGMDDGKAHKSSPLSPSAIVEETMESNGWSRDLIYLIPKPCDGFQFTEPGLVSVSSSGFGLRFGPKKWIHQNLQGKITTGMFSDYAVCCSEYREGDNTRIYLRGLLDHRSSRSPEPGKFELVSAR